MPNSTRHPNALAFSGVLGFVGVPTEKPPTGARGHRVLLEREAVMVALPTLVGMGVNLSPRCDNHETTRKIGVITQAEVRGDEIRIAGFLYQRDFRDDISRLFRAHVGMSYEICDAAVRDTGATIWAIKGFTFLGAAILERKYAAHKQTSVTFGVPDTRMSIAAYGHDAVRPPWRARIASALQNLWEEIANA